MKPFEKEMTYHTDRFPKPEILSQGEYKNFKYYVLNLGTHPCAYIDVTDTKLDGVDYSDIDIDCHGGLTYAKYYLNGIDESGERYFIGWDYAHICDYTGYEEMISPCIVGRKWTTKEMVNECKDVINQIVNMLEVE